MKAKTILFTLLLLLAGSQLVNAQNHCRPNHCSTSMTDEQYNYIVKKMSLNEKDAKKFKNAVAEYNKEKGNACTTNCNDCATICKTTDCKPGNCAENCKEACCNPNVKRLNNNCNVNSRLHYNNCDTSYHHNRSYHHGRGHGGHGRHCR